MRIRTLSGRRLVKLILLSTVSITSVVITSIPATASAETITFESLPVPGNGFYSGDVDQTGAVRDNYRIIGPGTKFGAETIEQIWTYEEVEFGNTDQPIFESPGVDLWYGWSWSNVQDTTTPGPANAFAASSGGGASSTGAVAPGETYLVAFDDEAFFNVPAGRQLDSVDLTNTTYAALSMLQGDSFAKRFGGISGNDPDLFRVILSGHTGVGGNGGLIGEVPVRLADYTFDDNSMDFVLTDWTRISLSSIADARSVSIRFESTDEGMFGVNTPKYVALDNLTFASAIPEPSCFAAITCLGLIGYAKRRTRRLR